MHSLPLSPCFASALDFAFKQATIEGKICIGTLLVVSIFSWTVIISKARQLLRARKAAKRFFTVYRSTRDPMEIARRGEEFDGAPAYELYYTGAEEMEYQLKNNPVRLTRTNSLNNSSGSGHTDFIARQITTKISLSSFESVRVALERAASQQALALEKGMIVLSTAVAGGPFIGLLGTVWGVMETFSGIAKAQSANLQAMAPGVAGALIATVTGLFVAIPAMFAYNYMVTSIRGITQELDAFASEYATALEHKYVDNRPLAEELRDALQGTLRGFVQAESEPEQRPARATPPALPEEQPPVIAEFVGQVAPT
jgi:biopolymer transport protein ExbB/TolQ